MAIDINIPSQVKNYTNLAGFPATGALKTIYIANDTNKTYRWTGSVYVEISGTDTSSLVPTSRTLTINGTTQDLSADRTFTISTGITIGTTAITSGTVGRVLFEGTGNVVSESANLFWDNTNARLGIGTSSPAYALDVNGTARVVGQGTIQTLTIGLGNNAIATNTALGYQVLLNANASNTGFNTGVGYQALSSILGNGGNTAVGYQALKNSTAATNTAVGFQAGLNNSGGDNVFMGYQAGLASTNTSSTIAIGAYALLSNISGTALTAIGRGALENATGGGNVAIGFWAGRSHTTGTNNIFIGNSSAGVSNTDSNRTWIGNSSTTTTWLAGNVLINTTTDAGFKLDVNGTFRSINGSRYIQTGSGNEFFTVHDGTNALLRANSALGWLILGRGENFKQTPTQTVMSYAYSGGGLASATKPFSFTADITSGNGGAGSRVMMGVDITGTLMSNYTEFFVHKITNALSSTYLNAVTYAYSNNDFHNAFNTNSGSTIIGGLSVNASAKLQVDSTTLGFLPPRMTTTQKNAIASPTAGLIVYDSTLNKLCLRTASAWETITSL